MKADSIFKKTLIFCFPAILILGLNACRKDLSDKKHAGKVYVANEQGGSVSVFDATTFEIIRTVDLTYKGDMYMAHNIQVAPDGRSVWITAIPMIGHGEEFLMVMEGKRDKVKEVISAGIHQHLAHVVVDDDSKFAYATSNGEGLIIKIDVEKQKVVNRFRIGTGTKPHGLRYMNGKLYVACMGSMEMQEVDASTGSVKHIPVGGIAVQTAVLPGLGSVFVSVYDRKEVVRYDLSSGDTTRISLPAEAQGPIQIYPSPDHQRVYVCDQGIVNGNPSSNKLYVINTGTNSVFATVTVGNGAHGVVVSGDGTKIYVTNTLDDTVSVVDASSLTVIATVPVGDAPNGISVLD